MAERMRRTVRRIRVRFGLCSRCWRPSIATVTETTVTHDNVVRHHTMYLCGRCLDKAWG